MSTYVTGFRSAGKEAALADDLSVVKRPAGVGEPDILFGTDHSGDGSMHIVFPVSTKIKLTKGRISSLAKFSEAVHDRIRELPVDVIAYVRFSETNR